MYSVTNIGYSSLPGINLVDNDGAPFNLLAKSLIEHTVVTGFLIVRLK